MFGSTSAILGHWVLVGASAVKVSNLNRGLSDWKSFLLRNISPEFIQTGSDP